MVISTDSKMCCPFFLDYHTGLLHRLQVTRYIEIGRKGIDQLGSLYGSIFLLFPKKVAAGHAHSTM